jgi:4-amino-4-deoxy-L-arabinose transferase-like glycosyltransferase
MINQPPLGFYMDAPVFHLAGLSYQNGVGVVTAFGLGCVVLVYALGVLLYGKNTGLVGAALFSLVPWHVYLSRIFLIDNQYLFFSLLALIVGVMAQRRQSDKLLLFSGVFFAVAFLTKLFAFFILVPLVLMALNLRRDGKFQLTAKKTLLFLAPTVVTQAIWYGVIANQNFFAVYLSSDFTHPELVADPVLGFLPIVLVKSIGWFLLLAAVLALALPLFFHNVFAGRTWLDAVCVVTIVAVAAANLLLVFGFHLKVPYISVVKYNYVALPFYCLLAASLADKGAQLLAEVKLRRNRELAKSVVVVVGLVLLVAALVESVVFLVEWEGFVSFGVDSVVYYGFEVYSPVADYFAEYHYLGLAVILASLALPLLFNALRLQRSVSPIRKQENGNRKAKQNAQ